VRAITGMIDLVHCNDSRDPFDSHRDRHANLGQGMVPSELLASMVAGANAPVVVETPGGVEEHLSDIAWVRAHMADLSMT
ncbi:MAG: TIM barrel protein, partial [Acidimicrobiia bacterium]|nr:TIM barrel protein [Acidimicrobiia bacterium]